MEIKEKLPTNEKEDSDSIFSKYGITFLENGKIKGPKRPEQYSQTPKFNFEEKNNIFSEADKRFFEEHLGKNFSVLENKKEIFDLVDKIFQSLVGRPFADFANVIVMSREDFAEFRNTIRPKLEEERGISEDINGINLGGLVVTEDSGGDNYFPLIFHEIGHNLYTDEKDNYIDELRAIYFQILCTDRLENEWKRMGINYSYPNEYYKDIVLPTEEHKEAYKYAKALFTYQSFYEEVVRGNERAEKTLDELLKIVKQDVKSFK